MDGHSAQFGTCCDRIVNRQRAVGEARDPPPAAKNQDQPLYHLCALMRFRDFGVNPCKAPRSFSAGQIKPF